MNSSHEPWLGVGNDIAETEGNEVARKCTIERATKRPWWLKRVMFGCGASQRKECYERKDG